ncbi:MAG: ribosome biogenesis GTP-binding protein YihA/YsxC [Bacteroidia bacterium]
MEIHSAKFVKSTAQFDQLPEPNYPEYGFVGRSNVGKSSLINSLVERKSLAKTSSTPGKTQLINHFLINDEWYLADLPGYGYAKVSKTLRTGFGKMITDYVHDRKNLLNLFVLVDSRLKPQKLDIEFIEFLGVKEIPFGIVFTKTDKLTQKSAHANQKAFREVLLQKWEQLPAMWFTSAVKGRGRKELLDFIEEVNQVWTPIK